MSEQTQIQELTQAIDKMTAKMALLELELTELKAHPKPITPVEQPVKSVVSVTRRATLKRLGLALLGGTVAAAAGATQAVEAKIIASPTLGNSTSKAGAVIVPPGVTPPSDNSPNGYYYGLLAFGKNSGLFYSLNPPGDTGVYGFGTYGLYGNGTYGMYGFGDNTGVWGAGDSIGVHGTSFDGTGVVAESPEGAPFRIVPGAQPGGTRQKGDMYVDSSGNLHVYNGSAWKTVTYN